jgi:hypothetical protein
MPIQEIGFENLPNLYVSEIVLHDKFSHTRGDKDSMLVSVRTIANDYVNDFNKLSWYNNEILTKYLRIIVLQSTSPAFTSDLTEGLAAMNPESFRKLASYTESDVVFKTLRFMTDSKPQEQDTIHEDDKLFSFLNDFNFEVPAGTDHLTYFACIYCDLRQAEEDLFLDFSNTMVNSYHGAVSSEKVLVAGRVQSRTYIFVRPDGSIYAGPVHEHQGGYMAGSYHSTEPHDSLTLQIEQNLKIKDKRNKLFDNKNKLQNYDKNPNFSQLYVSYDTSGSPNLFFTLNFRSMFLNNTLYGETLLNLDETLFDDVMKKFKIVLFNIDREQVNTGVISNTLSSPINYVSDIESTKNILNTYDKENFLLNAVRRFEKDNSMIDQSIGGDNHEKYIDFKEIAAIQEVFIDEDYSLRHFEFNDLELNKKTNGTFRYKVDMMAQDPTSEYTYALRHELNSVFSELEAYKIRVSFEANKKTTTNRLTDEFIKQELERYSENPAFSPWVRCVETYVRFAGYIFNISLSEQSDMKVKLYSQINPYTTNHEYVNSFAQKYSELIVQFDNFFDIRGDSPLDAKKVINKANSFLKNTFRISHSFDDLIQPNLNQSQIDFIGIENKDVGVLKVTKDYYYDLGNKQIEKMFYSAGSLTDEGFVDVSEEAKKAFNDISSYSMSYLSPQAIINERNTLNVSSDSIISMTEIKDAAIKAIDDTQSCRNRGSFTISIPPITLPAVENEESPFIKSKEFLTINSYFSLYDENINLCDNFADDNLEKVSQDLSDALCNPICHSITQYDFLEEENKLINLMKGENQSQIAETIRAIPLQIKALFASRSSKAKNNYADSPMNYLCAPETKYYIEVNHFTINTVEYISGYQQNSSGFQNIKMPIWKLLTASDINSATSPLVCRSITYENPSLGLASLCTLGIPTAHKFFIISNVDTRTKPSKNIDSYSPSQPIVGLNAENQFSVRVLYSTSNPIVQSERKSSLVQPNQGLRGRNNQTPQSTVTATTTTRNY